MRFSKISINAKGVTLVRETKDSNTGASEEIVLNSPESPLSSFDDALQAFDPYVRELLDGAIDLSEAELLVTTLNLSEDKNSNRGLIATATVKVPKAHDKPLVLNTPPKSANAEAVDEKMSQASVASTRKPKPAVAPAPLQVM
jgi:hypothetical protein